MKRKALVSLVLVFVLTFGLVETALATSVYLAANHHTRQFDAWNINPDGTVTYQDTYWLGHATDPAGIAIDAMTGTDPVTGQPRDPILFVSTEGTGGIEVINPVTLEFHGVAPGPVNMGGLDVDDANNILFAIQRGTSGWGGSGTSNLFVYTYNDDGSGIAQVANYTVPNHGYGMGLAFDDLKDVLWIADVQYSMVKAYKKDNPAWTSIHEEPSLSFGVSHRPVDIAVDRLRNIVYTGGAWFGSTLFTKYDVDTDTETSINTGQGVMGIAVDETTGYVYLTRGYGGDNVQVWDCSTSPFTLIQNTPRIGNPAGIAIGNVSYNPLRLAKNDVIVGEVFIGSTFTFEITYENPNPYDVNNVTVVDTLPGELDFVSASDGGVYDSVQHTVTWDIGTLAAGTPPTTMQLVVQVNANAVPGTTIHNRATVTGDEVPPTTVIDDEGSDDPQDEPGTPIGVPQPDLWAVEYRWGDPAPGYSFAYWPIFEGWMDVRIENRGAGDAFNVTAEIMSAPANTTVVDGDVTVGNIPTGSSAWSGDTFTTQVDMANPGDPCEEVFWRIEYDDMVGVHHVIENVPEFPPGEGPSACP